MRTASRVTLATILFVGWAVGVAGRADEEPAPRRILRPLKKPLAGPADPPPQPSAALSDTEILSKANLSPTDPKQLLEYLKQRSLSDADQARITEIITRFGADDFDTRERAVDEIVTFGSAAIGPLRKAERDADPEVAYRAREALRRVETLPHQQVTAAVVRTLARLKPDGAAAALLAFLPLADNERLVETIREALVELAVTPDGRAAPALLAALADPSPLRRSAAYVALVQGGDRSARIRIKEAYPRVREAVLKEADPETRFEGLWTLALTTREKEYLPELVRMIPKLPRGRLWQLEDLLLALAGTHPKNGRFLRTAEALERARDAWLAWWNENHKALDFAGLDYRPRILGITDVIEMDYRGYGQGRVVSLGPDMKERWSITGLNNPTDVRVAPNGHVWIVESNANLVTERTPEGRIVTRRNVLQQPVNLDLTPDGGLVVVCRNNIFAWDAAGKQLWNYSRNNYDIMAGRRLPNGEVLFVTNLFQQPNAPRNPNCFRIDANGKLLRDTPEAKKELTVGWIQQLQNLSVVGEDRILLCEREILPNGQQTDRVAEYEIHTGKQVRKYDCPLNSAPTSAQRLPNDNYLITLMNHNKVIEVDPSGEIVWEYQGKDGLRVGRAYRR